MTVVRRSAFTPFSAAQMYRLVNDVEAYPEFLPWCEDAAVLAHQTDQMQARVTIRKGRFHYSFVTLNRLEADRAIELELLEGPFRKLDGRWRFEAADGGCVVNLCLEFEFSNRLLGTALSAAFRPIADSLVDAFKRRAFAVYAG